MDGKICKDVKFNPLLPRAFLRQYNGALTTKD